jgi:hypothetical protein
MGKKLEEVAAVQTDARINWRINWRISHQRGGTRCRAA